MTISTPQRHVYRAKHPDKFGRYAYDAQDDGVWADLFTRQMDYLSGRIVPEFLHGVDRLNLSPAKVPQVKDINARLNKLTGAGVAGVPAIIPPTQFFTLLAQRKFPVATFLRRREDIDYIEEPDLFHEVFGHCPLLTNRSYADAIEAFGKTAITLDRKYFWYMFRLFWFTVEFGMIETGDGPRAYGAGIASSPAEAEHASSGIAQLRRFDLTEVLRTPYRIDIVQPVYFVIDSFEHLADIFSRDLSQEIVAAQSMGDLPASFDSAA